MGWDATVSTWSIVYECTPSNGQKGLSLIPGSVLDLLTSPGATKRARSFFIIKQWENTLDKI